MGEKELIVWDLGGTKCAAALMRYDEKTKDFSCLKRHSIKLQECGSLDQLVDNLETHLGLKM